MAVSDVDYYLLRPRTSSHPLLRQAYELWRDGRRSVLGGHDRATHLNSDEFARQDEVSILVSNGHCLSVTGLRWVDLSLPMGREDSCFRRWPDSAMKRIADRLVGLSSNTAVAKDWKRTQVEFQSTEHPHPTPLTEATTSLALRRFVDSAATSVVSTAPHPGATLRPTHGAPVTAIATLEMHGVDTDVLLFERTPDDTTKLGPVVNDLWSRRRHV